MHSPRPSLLLLPAAVAALALAGCSAFDDGGPQTVQQRDVAPFTRVKTDDSVDIRVRAGEPQRLRVRAGEKVIDAVHTQVRDGTLYVTFDHDSGIGTGDVVVEAGVRTLAGVAAGGSGDVDATGVEADAFDVRSDGSSDISIAGRAARLQLDVSGSGDIDTTDLAARDARVGSSGSGDVRVRAAERLDVALDGSGDVRYYGDPQLTRQLDGSGDLDHAG
jgi:hypothetical protein